MPLLLNDHHRPTGVVRCFEAATGIAIAETHDGPVAKAGRCQDYAARTRTIRRSSAGTSAWRTGFDEVR